MDARYSIRVALHDRPPMAGQRGRRTTTIQLDENSLTNSGMHKRLLLSPNVRGILSARGRLQASGFRLRPQASGIVLSQNQKKLDATLHVSSAMRFEYPHSLSYQE